MSEIIKPPPLKEYALQVTPERKLGMAEFGCHEGFPVIWLHGTPGGRKQVPFVTRQYAEENALRIITVERPGIGWSTRHLYENVREFSDDISRVAELLNLEKFGIVALSGGGPYSLACAHDLHDRVVATSVFGGVAPTVGPDAPEDPGLTGKFVKAEKALTWMNRPLGNVLSGTVRMLHPVADPVLDAIVKYIPGHETEMIAKPEFREMFITDMLHSSKAGVHSLVSDTILFLRDWGFSLGDIAVPVHFWQGDEDPLVPVHHAEAMANLVPNSRLTVCENTGHLEGLNKTREALQFILEHK